MAWRDKYLLHPACLVFHEMHGEKLRELGEDIEPNGLRDPITVCKAVANGKLYVWLVDGRNRLIAMEMVGLDTDNVPELEIDWNDAVAHARSANIHRRHLTKQEWADLIVATLRWDELAQLEPVSPKG